MNSGCYRLIFDKDELDNFKNKFIGCCEASTKIKGQIMRAIDSKNQMLFPWYQKTLESKLQFITNDKFNTIVAMFTNWTYPVNIHQDFIELPGNKKGKNYKSFLIPLNVDGDTNLCSLASTVTFTKRPNQNAISDHKKLFSHMKIDDLKQYTIENIHQWNFGDLIWWYSDQYHASSDFTNKATYKEAFVIHTYV